jgi:hypothetical protein
MLLRTHLVGDNTVELRNLKIRESVTLESDPTGTPANGSIFFRSGVLMAAHPDTGVESAVDAGITSIDVSPAGGALSAEQTGRAVTLTIRDASTTESGVMSSAFYNLLNDATELATAGTLAIRDGSGNVAFNEVTSVRVTGLSSPSEASDATSKDYVDTQLSTAVSGLAQGLAVKQAVRAVATTNITLSGLQTVDSVVLAAGDRVLAAGQTDATTNGIYTVVDGGAWTRSTDFDEDSEVASGIVVAVTEGSTSNADSLYILQSDGTLTVGTSELNFTHLAKLTDIAVGDGLYKVDPTTLAVQAYHGIATSANGVSVQAADSSLVVDASGVAVNPTWLDTPANWLSTPSALNDALTDEFTQAFGDGTNTVYSIAHNLNGNIIDMDVAIVHELATQEVVMCDLVSTDVNTVQVTLTSPPASNAFRLRLKKAK